MGKHLHPVRTLLAEMAKDDYVRFKYGKRVDAALKLLEASDGGPDAAAIEARLLEALDLVRGGRTKPARAKKDAAKEAGAPAPEAKSRKRPPQAPGA